MAISHCVLCGLQWQTSSFCVRPLKFTPKTSLLMYRLIAIFTILTLTLCTSNAQLQVIQDDRPTDIVTEASEKSENSMFTEFNMTASLTEARLDLEKALCALLCKNLRLLFKVFIWSRENFLKKFLVKL